MTLERWLAKMAIPCRTSTNSIAQLRGLVSLDLTSCGTFYDSERVGYKNLDSFRREKASQAGAIPLLSANRRPSGCLSELGASGSAR